MMESMVELQRQRANDFNLLVNNDTRAKAFQMAALGYKTLKDDPVERQKNTSKS